MTCITKVILFIKNQQVLEYLTVRTRACTLWSYPQQPHKQQRRHHAPQRHASTTPHNSICPADACDEDTAQR